MDFKVGDKIRIELDDPDGEGHLFCYYHGDVGVVQSVGDYLRVTFEPSERSISEDMGDRVRLGILRSEARLCRDEHPAAALAACSPGVTSPVEMVITEVYLEDSPMGCIGTNWHTILRAEDGRSAKVCGKWGKPGDKVSGFWIAGASDPNRNGFRFAD